MLTLEQLAELREVAACEVCQSTEWVSEQWALEHFGSDAEAKFVAKFSPVMIMKLLNHIDAQQTKEKCKFCNGSGDIYSASNQWAGPCHNCEAGKKRQVGYFRRKENK